MTCKQYFHSRKCLTLQGGACFNRTGLKFEAYELKINSSTGEMDCTELVDQCYYEMCLVDTAYQRCHLYKSTHPCTRVQGF